MASTSTPELPSPRSAQHSPQSAPLPDAASAGAHWCGLCKRSFERSDHFARHVQSHEDLRLFQCPWCPKAFNRGDLLYRHKQIHTRRKQGAQYSSRASRACRNCVQSKAKCTDQKPCTRCISKNIPCEPNVKPQKRHQDSDSRSNRGLAPNSDHSPVLDLDPVVTFNPSDIPVEFDPAFQQSRGGYSLLDAFLLPAEGFEADSGCFDLDLETLQLLTEPAAHEIPRGDVNNSPNNPSPAASRFEFFKRSPWLWTPVPVDNAYTTQENLGVNENTLGSSFALQERLYFQDSVTASPVDSGCRDRILFMIFNTAKPALPLQSFPSASFLERMVQVYFSWNNLQSLSWIHSPSFSPANSTPETLGLIIAAGLSSISIPTVWKMAYALQERSRLSLSASIEHDNSRVRDLQTLQAYLLWVSMGLWSGFKRNMELAESFLVAPITMLRRGGSFARHPYTPGIRPYNEDEGNVLHAKWISWSRQESLKRTAIFAVMTDLRCSMAYLRPPNCSLTELSCPLPAARDLWLAPDAASWKEAFLGKPPRLVDQGGIIPSWATIMEDGSLLEELQPHYDTSLIAHVVVHGFWTQIWAYHESIRFFRHKKDRASQARTMLWLSCQHQDLAQCLTAAKRDLVKYALHPAQLGMIAEFSLMALAVSPRELQRFAGRLGEEEEEEAEETHKTLQQWMTGPEFRAAVWHAGQILRLARSLPLTQLREFQAIALYQASLTLWVYGLLSEAQAQFRPDSGGGEAGSSRVFLDEPECPGSIAFVALGRGVPGISFGINKELCPLSNGGNVMKVACDIYRENFGLETASLPPLLESLISLMTDLGSISADSMLLDIGRVVV